MVEHDGDHLVRPPVRLRVVVLLTLGLFTLVEVGILFSGQSAAWRVTGGLLILLSLLAVIESFLAFVRLREQDLVVRSLFRTRRIPLRDVVDVKLEGGRTWLKLSRDEWYGLPEWVEGGERFPERVRAKLRRHVSN